MNSHLSVHLPKWPGFVVVGDPVTTDQAAEILLKTDTNFPDFQYASNAHDLGEEACKLLGIPYSRRTARSSTEDQTRFLHRCQVVDRLKAEYDVLELEYLHNSRIASSYIGGTHGWCNWDGSIGCNSFNIGKWPSAETVFKEWQLIAKSFPFLNLQCHLLSTEINEASIDGPSQPRVHYVVKNGEVTTIDPVELPQPKNRPAPIESLARELAARLATPSLEWSVSLDQLKHLVEKVYGRIITVP